MSQVFNFSAGPATLPASVLEEVKQTVCEIPGVGISPLCISHRSDWCIQMMDETIAGLRQLMGIPEDYHVLFLQGGASLQFSMAPMNFLKGKTGADYLVTGTWGGKAIAEAKREGNPRVAWDGKATKYTRVPKPDEYKVDPNAAYLHFTSNETIQGVQFRSEPQAVGVPLICDQSSDFLSRPIDIGRYAMIYAGAQKNAGPAGVTMVIVRDDLLKTIPDGLHTMLDYRTYSTSQSAHNTPPVFAIFVVRLVLKWIAEQMGGLNAMEQFNAKKAQLLYDAIDKSDGFYRPHAEPSSRSMMNVTWTLANEDMEKSFLKQSSAHGLLELKGHRSVGGIRASIYNAMPLAGVAALRDFMIDFQKRT